MHYELIYTQDDNKDESLIGAQIGKTFVPKKPDETDQSFFTRVGIAESNGPEKTS